MANFSMTPEMIDDLLRGGMDARVAKGAATAGPSWSYLGGEAPGGVATTPAQYSIPSGPGATPSVASKGASLWDALTKSRSVMGTAKAVGPGALRVGAATGRSLLSPAALVPTLAGMTASKMAGGDLTTGMDPAMFSRALGEGYARYAPTWMGGLTSKEVAAGDEMGASDIGGDRFGAVAAPRPLAASAIPKVGGLAEDIINATQPDTSVRMPTFPVNPPFTSEDIDSNRIPARGTGAFRNERTGGVTQVGAPIGPGSVSPSLRTANTSGVSGFGAAPLSPVASFFQAGAGLKTMANKQVADAARLKLGLDFMTKLPGMDKDTAAAALDKTTVEAAQRASVQGATPAEIAAILGKRAGPQPHPLQFPVNLQPMPGTADSGYAVAVNPNLGSASATRIPIRSSMQVRKGSDGKTYVMKPDGTPLREATAEEVRAATKK
jgi:hypothetical protein